MKKIFAVAACLLITTSVVFVSCEKDGSEQLTPTTVTCQDSVYAWLMADSISCPGKNFFKIPITATTYKLVAVAYGNTAIDTIVGNAAFTIAFDSLPGTTPCQGAIFQNASVVCFKRL